MGVLGEVGYERRLKKLVRRTGPGWEIVTAGTVQIGDVVLTVDKGPLVVVAITTPDSPLEPQGEDTRDTPWSVASDMIRVAPPQTPSFGGPLALNLDNKSIWLGVSMKKLARKA